MNEGPRTRTFDEILDSFKSANGHITGHKVLADLTYEELFVRKIEKGEGEGLTILQAFCKNVANHTYLTTFTKILNKFKGKLSFQEFYKVIMSGPDQGKSALWFLACAARKHPEIFIRIWNNGKKEVSPVDQFASLLLTALRGDEAGVSTLWWLALEPQPSIKRLLIEIFTHYPGKIPERILRDAPVGKGSLRDLINLDKDLSFILSIRTRFFEELDKSIDELDFKVIEQLMQQAKQLPSPSLYQMFAQCCQEHSALHRKLADNLGALEQKLASLQMGGEDLFPGEPKAPILPLYMHGQDGQAHVRKVVATQSYSSTPKTYMPY
ncbi:MAG: hypothetical protein JSR17_00285 [Proteobacteria bacterium]|nr:hypothetical protein [Pseudomonadota bacterium]